MIFPSLSTPLTFLSLSLLVFPWVAGFWGWKVLAGRTSLRGTSDHDTYAGRDVRTVWAGEKVELVEEVEEEVVEEVVDDEGKEGALPTEV
jgi:hypothetical protein